MPENPMNSNQPRLFMTELTVRDWNLAVGWYVASLGLTVKLKDETGRFALLGDPESGQLAIKGTRDSEEGTPTRVRLVFQVDDLEAFHRRLKLNGVEVGDITTNDRERYREVRLVDPEGTPITVFDWV